MARGARRCGRCGLPGGTPPSLLASRPAPTQKKTLRSALSSATTEAHGEVPGESVLFCFMVFFFFLNATGPPHLPRRARAAQTPRGGAARRPPAAPVPPPDRSRPPPPFPQSLGEGSRTEKNVPWREGGGHYSQCPPVHGRRPGRTRHRPPWPATAGRRAINHREEGRGAARALARAPIEGGGRYRDVGLQPPWLAVWSARAAGQRVAARSTQRRRPPTRSPRAVRVGKLGERSPREVGGK